MIEPTGKETVDFEGATSEKIFLDEVEQKVGQEELEIPENSQSSVTSSTQVQSVAEVPGSVKSAISTVDTPDDIPLKKSATSIKSESLPAAKSVTSQASQAKATASAISVKSALSAESVRSTNSAVSAQLSAKSVVSTKSAATQVALPGMSRGGGVQKVTACGTGLERGTVNIPADFSISTRKAGAGSLLIAVKGPAKAKIDFDDREDGSCGVSYSVPQQGEYQ